MTQVDDTIEISFEAANALAHHFGHQQWLSANADSEYIQKTLQEMDAIIRFLEAYTEQTDDDVYGMTPTVESVLRTFDDDHLPFLTEHFEPEQVLEGLHGLEHEYDPDYHPVLVSLVEREFGGAEEVTA